jgi:hypothetical protein
MRHKEDPKEYQGSHDAYFDLICKLIMEASNRERKDEPQQRGRHSAGVAGVGTILGEAQ